MINVDVSAKHSRKTVCEKGYIWNPTICSSESGRYVKSVVDDSVIKCDEIIEATKINMTKTALAKSISASFKLKQGDLKNKKFVYFTCLFINYKDIIKGC